MYVGSLITENGKCEEENKVIGMAKEAFQKMHKILREKKALHENQVVYSWTVT